MGLASTIIGGAFQRDATRDATRAQQQSTDAAIAEDRRQFDLTRADMAPWLQAGQSALNRLQDPGANFQTDPGYNFLRREGMRDIGNSFAARGGAASGNALRALAEFQTGIANQSFGDWWNRQAGMAGIGQTTASNLGTLGAQSAGNIGALLTNQGNNRASGILGQQAAFNQLWQNSRQNTGNILGMFFGGGFGGG
jgi:hypothetical protein